MLEGMRGMLSRRRVEFVEFEFSAHKGYWHRGYGAEQRTLKATLAWLRALGYTCYMEAGPDLAPISGECWRDVFGSNGWSNVLCAHSERALRLLDGMAAAGAERRRRAILAGESS